MASLLLPPIAGGIVMFLTYVGLWYVGMNLFEGTPSDLRGAGDTAIGLALGVTIVGFVMTGVAVPAVLWMVRRGPLTLKNVLLLGTVLGTVPPAVFVVSILGPSAAAMFWMIGVRGNQAKWP